MVANRAKCSLAFGNTAIADLLTVNNMGKKTSRILYGSVVYCMLTFCADYLYYISIKITNDIQYTFGTTNDEF